MLETYSDGYAAVLKTAAIETLERAVDVLSEYGWLQGKYGDKGIGFCSAGAIYEAARPVYYSYRVYYGVASIAADHIDVGLVLEQAESLLVSFLALEAGAGDIEEWNDKTGRSAEDVKLAFKHTIEKARTEL